MIPSKTDILIVGGGLAGLSLANHLQRLGRDYYLLEARERFGGRIMTHEHNSAVFDLGPAWFWLGQPRMERLVQELDLTVFEQHSQGDLVYEDEQGRVQRGAGYAAMAGSLRLDGGSSALTDALASNLTSASLSTRVVSIKQDQQDLTVTYRSGTKTGTLHADRVVLALPPRVAAHTIDLMPELPKASRTTMENTSTWMAGQAKAIAIYDSAFWHDAGLSGDAISRHGPMVEIHDASPHGSSAKGPGGLFGFIGVPPQHREDETALKQAVLQQLTRIFGEEAGKPAELIIKDWATDPLTATPRDHAPLHHHPHYGLPMELTGLMAGRLLLGSTEIATQFGGYLEGALEASETVLATLRAHKLKQQAG